MSKTKKENTITCLTPEQEAMIPVYRDKFLAMGLATETDPTLDPEKIRPLVNHLYESAGLKPPEIVIHVHSPMDLFLAYACLISQENV